MFNFVFGKIRIAIMPTRHTGSVLSLEQQRNQRSVEFFLQERKLGAKSMEEMEMEKKTVAM